MSPHGRGAGPPVPFVQVVCVDSAVTRQLNERKKKNSTTSRICKREGVIAHENLVN